MLIDTEGLRSSARRMLRGIKRNRFRVDMRLAAPAVQRRPLCRRENDLIKTCVETGWQRHGRFSRSVVGGMTVRRRHGSIGQWLPVDCLAILVRINVRVNGGHNQPINTHARLHQRQPDTGRKPDKRSDENWLRHAVTTLYRIARPSSFQPRRHAGLIMSFRVHAITTGTGCGERRGHHRMLRVSRSLRHTDDV